MLARLVIILHGRKELNVIRYNFGHISLRTVLRIIRTGLDTAGYADLAALGEVPRARFPNCRQATC